MATAEQLKAMIRSYVEGDRERFLTVSMQVAAHAGAEATRTWRRHSASLLTKQSSSLSCHQPGHLCRLHGQPGNLPILSPPLTRRLGLRTWFWVRRPANL